MVKTRPIDRPSLLCGRAPQWNEVCGCAPVRGHQVILVPAARGQEPLHLFRTYMATYAREQAYCHFSPALIANLEKHWNARQRKP